MKVLVTGAAGFLGFHVARRLVEDGHEVTGFDLLPTDESGFSSVIGDLTVEEDVAAAASGMDLICHVGAIGDVYLAGDRPALAAAVNVTGTAHVAAAAAKAGARVVYASTWEVYGAPAYTPIDELHPCSPDHPYNITKLAGESLLLAAEELSDIEVLCLRLGTAFGPGLRPNSVFRIFLDRARRGEPITIQGDGSQGRQFTNAADIANAFSLACAAGLSGQALNIVSPRMITIRELAQHVTDLYPTTLEFGPPRPGDPPSAEVSSAKAEELLGWAAQVDFEVGLAELAGTLG